MNDRTKDQIPMGAPGSTAKTWRCSCGHVNDKLGPCQSGCGRSRTVTPPASTSSKTKVIQSYLRDASMCLKLAACGDGLQFAAANYKIEEAQRLLSEMTADETTTEVEALRAENANLRDNITRILTQRSAVETTAEPPPTAQWLAVQFHETYERLAPKFGYETRRGTRHFDPESPNGRLMMAVCAELLTREPALNRAAVEPTPVTNTTSEAAKVPGATDRFTPPYSVDNGDSKSVATLGSAQGPVRCECGHSDVSHFIGSTDIKGPCGVCGCMGWRQVKASGDRCKHGNEAAHCGRCLDSM